MPLTKLKLPPGIDKVATDYSSSGRWVDSNNIRFRGQYAETIGGWVRDNTYTLEGIGRESFTSRDYSGNNYQFVGTDWKYYVIAGATSYDITPTESGVTVGGNYLIGTNDEDLPFLKVTISNHGRSVNDWINFSGSSTVPDGGSFEDAILNQDKGFQITEIVDSSNFWIYLEDSASNTKWCPNTEFGDSTYHFRISSGTSSVVLGSGFGVSGWGGTGAVSLYTSGTFDGSVGPTTENFSILRFNGNVPSALTTDDYVFFRTTADDGFPAGAEVAGIDLVTLNGKWLRVTAVSGTSFFEVDGGLNANDDATYIVAGGTTIDFYYQMTPPAPGWGAPAGLATLLAENRRIYIDNYGEDIIFANSGGPLFYWDVSVNAPGGAPSGSITGVAKEINDTNFNGSVGAPAKVDSFLISKKDGHCIALGCSDLQDTVSQNSLLVRWSDQNNPFDWFPSVINTSGGQMLRSGSRIICAVSTEDEVIIFTDSSVYSMRFIGPPSVFSFTMITQGVEIIGAKAAIDASNSVFFMGTEGFYVYSGSVSPLYCPVANYVFDDFNPRQSAKVFASTNSSFSEVQWFYPSAKSYEPDRYVCFNYLSKVWTIGKLDMSPLDNASTTIQTSVYNRTSWRDAIVFGNPMSTYIVSYNSNPSMIGSERSGPVIENTGVMIHETGNSANSKDMNCFVTSGDMEIADGNSFSFYDQLIPDIAIFNRTSSGILNIPITITGKNYPGGAISSTDSLSASFPASETNPPPPTASKWSPDKVDDGFQESAFAVRGRARSVQLKAETTGDGFQWRLGDLRINLQPDGRR